MILRANGLWGNIDLGKQVGKANRPDTARIYIEVKKDLL